ncbi:AMMECR1 domain-containing protein [Lipomyces arxii]|uniref:AMMECR1 domain-containing protein n=1 Tax=Lipomyces arxii TaxID=56418 RepID=UPI0034CEFF5D
MATKAQCAFCFDIIVSQLENRNATPLIKFEQAMSKLNLSDSDGSSVSSAGSVGYSDVVKSDSELYPLFVTWNIVIRGESRLRGCIGTFEPQPLEKGLKNYAKIAAFDDTRFNPISVRELSSLECGVSLLCDFEDAEGPMDWEWGVHGIRISFIANGRRYSATYLPDVPPEHFRTKEETIESLVNKAGYHGSAWKSLPITLRRYKSSKEHLLFAEYLALKKKV